MPRSYGARHACTPFRKALFRGAFCCCGTFGGALECHSALGPAGEHDLHEGNVTEGDAEYRDLRHDTRISTERANGFVGGRHTRPWLLNLDFTAPQTSPPRTGRGPTRWTVRAWRGGRPGR
ncbi:hypothetical protein [Streptomyces sp. Ac-502]|uniref:hypothetical protein n=1 Tax=Streptomyces sp. Ac-502 TaxID=3342801 RepID=UPI0038626575